MKISNANVRACLAIAEELARSGVTDACISPGSRSTPMVMAMVRGGGIRPWVILDERSAAFFALGMARETGRPVAMLCTSGTAAANYAPAIAEASLEAVPLIVITADRPPELRDCHAPQTIDQVRMYCGHVRWAVDAPAPADGCDLEGYYRAMACRAVAVAAGAMPGPVHINLPMREPLIDVDEEMAALSSPPPDLGGRPPHVRSHRGCFVPPPAALERLAESLEQIERGVVVCGPLRQGPAQSAIGDLARRLGWPILADPLSGLRWGPSDRDLVVDAYDLMLREEDFARIHQPEAVLRFGLPPVSKVLTEFLGPRRPVHIVVAMPGDWPDPAHNATDIVHADAAEFCGALAALVSGPRPQSRWLESWTASSRAARAALDAQLREAREMFEGRVFMETISRMPADAVLHVGNSMPVRDLDMFAGASPNPLRAYCNRGANGIDGVVSTAMGAAAARSGPTVLIVGDLSFLHDVGAMQIAARHRVHVLIVVLNNDGGGIFSFLPQASLEPVFEPFFGTPHGLSVEGVVRMCGGSWVRTESWDDYRAALKKALAEPAMHVIEVPGNRVRNLARHREITENAIRALREHRSTREAR